MTNRDERVWLFCSNLEGSCCTWCLEDEAEGYASRTEHYRDEVPGYVGEDFVFLICCSHACCFDVDPLAAVELAMSRR